MLPINDLSAAINLGQTVSSLVCCCSPLRAKVPNGCPCPLCGRWPPPSLHALVQLGTQPAETQLSTECRGKDFARSTPSFSPLEQASVGVHREAKLGDARMQAKPMVFFLRILTSRNLLEDKHQPSNNEMRCGPCYFCFMAGNGYATSVSIQHHARSVPLSD